MVFTFSREGEITPEVIEGFIERHNATVPKLQESYKMYTGEHEIFNKVKDDTYKPNNKLMANFSKYIVDTTEGYFIGVPVKVTHKEDIVNETITMFRNSNDMAEVESEVSKLAAIYGQSFLYIYQDELSQTRVVENGPEDMFIVHDDTIAELPLFAVRYFLDADEKMQGELITEEGYFIISEGDDGLIITENGTHFYGGLPVIEWVQNAERQSVFEHVKSLINGLNNAISEKANDVEYFADSYMKILGAKLEERKIQELRDSRIINLEGDGADKIVVEFMTKPSADELQENLIDRLIDLIYQLSMTANMNDDTFGGGLSGVAMEFKLQGMKNMAIMKERKAQGAMGRMYKALFNLPTNINTSKKDEWMNLNYQFSRNIPRNLQDEADTMQKMEGIVSKETQLGVSSMITDVKEEIDRMNTENLPTSGYDIEAGD